MRRSFSLSVLVITLLILISLSIISIQPALVYGQEILEGAPDLSGLHIYFSEANREMSQYDRGPDGVSRYAGLLRLMGADLFTLEWRKGIPADADLIVIPAPTGDLTPDMVARLWSYLERGGNVIIVTDALDVNGNVNRALGTRGLFELTWGDLGIQARPDVIVSEGPLEKREVVETDRDGNVTFEFSGELPALNTTFLTQRMITGHSITRDLGAVLAQNEDQPANMNHFYFSGSRSIQIDASIQDFSVTPLIFTQDPDQYGETDYNRYLNSGYVEYNIGTDSQRGDLILAAVYEKTTSGARMLLIGDGDFIRNGSGFDTSPSYSGSFVYPMNAHFMVRASAWILDREPSNTQFATPAPTGTATVTPTPTPTATPDAGN